MENRRKIWADPSGKIYERLSQNEITEDGDFFWDPNNLQMIPMIKGYCVLDEHSLLFRPLKG
jgi:hypothetical protein